MKDPKALFPFLFATSWLGNLLLTALAFYLAFTHDGPLTPIVFLTVAVCILAGNLLPVSVYLVLVYWRQAELKAETREAAVLLRDALDRSEEVMDRLDESRFPSAYVKALSRWMAWPTVWKPWNWSILRKRSADSPSVWKNWARRWLPAVKDRRSCSPRSMKSARSSKACLALLKNWSASSRRTNPVQMMISTPVSGSGWTCYLRPLNRFRIPWRACCNGLLN